MESTSPSRGSSSTCRDSSRSDLLQLVRQRRAVDRRPAAPAHARSCAMSAAECACRRCAATSSAMDSGSSDSRCSSPSWCSSQADVLATCRPGPTAGRARAAMRTKCRPPCVPRRARARDRRTHPARPAGWRATAAPGARAGRGSPPASSQFGQLPDRRRTTIDPCAGAAIRAQRAAQLALATVIEFGAAQPFAARPARRPARTRPTSSARSAPWRTMPLSARCPDRKASASTSNDLPAPVSPEMTVSPAPKSSSAARRRRNP